MDTLYEFYLMGWLSSGESRASIECIGMKHMIAGNDRRSAGDALYRSRV